MKYKTFDELEKKFSIYSHILDSLKKYWDIKGSICDLSFNNHITADFLFEKNKDLKRIYSFFDDNKNATNENIFSVKNSPNLAKALERTKSNLVMSILGTYKFQPIYDVVQAIHKSLYVGGSFVFILCPFIYDENGKDVLYKISQKSQIPVHEKLGRWKSVLENGLNHIFFKVEQDVVINEISLLEIVYLFSLKNIYSYLFENKEDFLKFTELLKQNENKKYTAFWHIISGIRL